MAPSWIKVFAFMSITGLLSQGCLHPGTKPCFKNGTADYQYCYDPLNESCCNGTVRTLPGPEYKCCKGTSTFYDKTQFICCGSIVEQLDSNRFGCCNGESYDKFKLICCSGVLHKRESPEGGQYECCGSKAYLFGKETCCEDAARPEEATIGPLKGRCCMDLWYDPAKDVCTEGTLHKPVCDGVPYKPSHSTCCGGKLHHTGAHYSPECCGTTVLYPGYICCDGQIKRQNKRNTRECCPRSKSGFIDTRRHLCCDKRRYIKESEYEMCCGDRKYDIRLQQCCFNDKTGETNVASLKTQRCCGATAIGLDEKCCVLQPFHPEAGDICCEKYGPIQKDRPEYDSCCVPRDDTPPLLYDSRNEICHLGKVYVKERGIEWCGGKAYDPLYEMCCMDRLYSNQGGYLHCCRGEIFNGGLQICYDGSVYTVEIESLKNKIESLGIIQVKRHNIVKDLTSIKFCRDQLYDTQHQLCCGGVISSKEPGWQCCGNLAFNPSTESCCSGLITARDVKCSLITYA